MTTAMNDVSVAERVARMRYMLERRDKLPEDQFDYRLRPHHRREFVEGSGISPEVIEAAQIFSLPCPVTDSPSLGIIIGRTYNHQWGGSSVVPHFDENGEPHYCCLKHDEPRYKRDEPDKPIYYENVYGAGNPPCYFPIDSRKLIKRGAELVLFTEGDKKALSAYSGGYKTVIGLNGAWGAKGGGGPRSYKLHPDLEKITWCGRTVLIVLDSDSVENEQVGKAEQWTKKAIERLGRRQARDNKAKPPHVVVVHLPPGEDSSKQGLDDFIVAHGAEAFHQLVNDSIAQQPAALPHVSDVETKDRAAMFEDEHPTRLVYWNGYLEDCPAGAKYKVLPDEQLFDLILSYHGRTFARSEPSHAASTRSYLRSRIRLDASKELPAWLDEPPSGFENLNECITTLDGTLINLLTGAITSRTDSLLNTVSLPLRYDPAAKPPELLREFLEDALRHKYQIDIFLKFVAYLLTPDVSYHKMLQIYGPPGSGKGTCMRLIEHLLGKEQVMTQTLTSLCGPHAMGDAVGKAAMIIHDAQEHGARHDVAVETLKNISGGDPIRINPKNKPAFDAHLPMKVILCGNKPMPFNDAADSLRRRCNPTTLRTYVRDPSKPEIPNLAEKIIEADGGAGLLNVLIEKWRELHDAGRFPELPKGAPGLEILETSSRQNSPVLAFFDDELTIHTGWIAERRVYALYKHWCDQNGEKPLRMSQFRAELLEVLEGKHPGKVHPHRPIIDGKKRARGYRGLRSAASVEIETREPRAGREFLDEYTEGQVNGTEVLKSERVGHEY